MLLPSQQDAGAPAAVAVLASVASGPTLLSGCNDPGPGPAAAPVATDAVRVSQPVVDPADPEVAMYRPKSLRDHQLFHRTREALLQQGQNPSVHGGRRVVSWTRPSFFCLFWGVTISPTFLGAAH